MRPFRRAAGLTLLEVVTAMGIVALFAALVVAVARESRQRVRLDLARAEMQTLRLAAGEYFSTQRAYPGGDMEDVIRAFNGRHYQFPLERLKYAPSAKPPPEGKARAEP